MYMYFAKHVIGVVQQKYHIEGNFTHKVCIKTTTKNHHMLII